jgi:hypothetical protein
MLLSFPPIELHQSLYVSTDSWHLLGSSPAGYREPYLVSWREEGAPTWHQQEQELLPGDMPTLRIGSCLFHIFIFTHFKSRKVARCRGPIFRPFNSKLAHKTCYSEMTAYKAAPTSLMQSSYYKNDTKMLITVKIFIKSAEGYNTH